MEKTKFQQQNMHNLSEKCGTSGKSKCFRHIYIGYIHFYMLSVYEDGQLKILQ